MSKWSSDWHITGWKAFALLPLAIPVALLLKIFNVGQSKERSPEEVAGFIRDFIEDSGGEWDWDDFTSVTIKSPELDSRRSLHDRPTGQRRRNQQTERAFGES